MRTIPFHIQQELLQAMDNHSSIVHALMKKLISEINQPEKEKIAEGHYYEIEDADLLNGEETLSDNSGFEVHGEHCLFKNQTTGQSLEVFLGNEESIDYLDPYFFYNFLKTTNHLQHLTTYFENPFQDMLSFFEKMEQEQKLTQIHGICYRKI
ncbi:hypothetical protein HX096_10280 [Empedobacter falsenii]|uniref:DUF6896 domain-containing protein n=1 Tax=Empedobacter falsenii TaxID=343874 RepID=UPI002578326C|nr:hypothetical protein [Empedobacter falsenii]MDM1548239.1 hypothetical protein [Empedobacter falsenii]